jgi:murein DD-endopeptidase MepM/ murein hydrolase activator NlpD
VAVGPTVTVREGDTVYEIAQRYEVPLRDLIEANNLGPPFDVRPGAVLRLPTTREHIVQATDTLSEIAERHGMTIDELAELNAIDPPYTIYVGQPLRLPGPPQSGSPGRPGTVSAAAPGDPQPGSVGEPVSLAPGAGRVEREPLDPPERRPAQAASIYATPEPGAPDAGAPADLAPEDAISEAGDRPGLAGRDDGDPVAGALPPAPPDRPGPALEAEPRRAGLPADVAPPARSGSLFQWPVRGQVVAGFGESTESGRNEGINIAAPRGAPILAAENGVVAYAGNELRGYGNLLLIRHADGWVTAYAHTEDILVERGAPVAAGQQVATVGATGAVSSPQLHFEIRQGSDSVDPLDYLP